MERASQSHLLVRAARSTWTGREPRFDTVIRADFRYGITHRQVIVPSGVTVRYQLRISLVPTPEPKKSLRGVQTVSSPSKVTLRMEARSEDSMSPWTENLTVS
ncbi:MAG TPA: hypothetical protein DCM86_01505 [Verrucomicrobiales bacterium]|nr:hypothetical protein [Verrucomicrobiales bacterium]